MEFHKLPKWFVWRRQGSLFGPVRNHCLGLAAAHCRCAFLLLRKVQPARHAERTERTASIDSIDSSVDREFSDRTRSPRTGRNLRVPVRVRVVGSYSCRTSTAMYMHVLASTCTCTCTCTCTGRILHVHVHVPFTHPCVRVCTCESPTKLPSVVPRTAAILITRHLRTWCV